MMQTLADRVRWLVETSHASLNSAAHDIGLPQSTLQRTVNQPTRKPRLETIVAICSFYGASVDWLLTGTGTPPEVAPYVSPDEQIRRLKAEIQYLKSEFKRHGISFYSFGKPEPIEAPPRVEVAD